MKYWRFFLLMGGILWGLSVDQSKAEKSSQDLIMRFALMTEPKSDLKRFRTILDDAKSEKCEFVIVAGDLTKTSKEKQWKAIMKAIKKAPLPVHVTAGNHDLSWREENGSFVEPYARYTRYTGNPANYVLSKGPVKFIFLSLVDDILFDKTETYWYDYLDQELAKSNQDDKGFVFVVMHQHLEYRAWGKATDPKRVLRRHRPVIWLSGENNNKVKGFRVKRYDRGALADILPPERAAYYKIEVYLNQVVAQGRDAKKAVDVGKAEAIIYDRQRNQKLSQEEANEKELPEEIAAIWRTRKPLNLVSIEEVERRIEIIDKFRSQLDENMLKGLLNILMVSSETDFKGNKPFTEKQGAKKSKLKKERYDHYQTDAFSEEYLQYIDLIVEKTKAKKLPLDINFIGISQVDSFWSVRDKIPGLVDQLRERYSDNSLVRLGIGYIDIPYGSDFRITKEYKEVSKVLSPLFQNKKK